MIPIFITLYFFIGTIYAKSLMKGGLAKHLEDEYSHIFNMQFIKTFAMALMMTFWLPFEIKLLFIQLFRKGKWN